MSSGTVGCVNLSGKYWYYGLLIVSLALLVMAIRHRRNWKLLVMQLMIFAVIHPFELIILLTNGYRYWPGITDTVLDIYIGSFISNLCIVPASAMVLNAYRLSWRYKLGFAVAFTFVDWYFTVLGIYQHFWWKSIYTGLGLLILYALNDWIWSRMVRHYSSQGFRLVIIYLTYFALHTVLTFAVNQGGEVFQFQLESVPLEPVKTMALLSVLYQSVISVVVTLAIGLKTAFRYRMLGVLVIVGVNGLLGHFGIFIPQAPVTVQWLLLIPLVAIGLLSVLFKKAQLKYLFP